MTNNTMHMPQNLNSTEPSQQAVLGAWVAGGAGAAAVVEGRIEALPSTVLPHLHVIGIRAAAALQLGLLFNVHGFLFIFLIVRGILQSLQVVDLHAAQLVELQAAVFPHGARVIRRQSGVHVLPEGTREAQEHEESSEGHGWQAGLTQNAFGILWSLRAR